MGEPKVLKGVYREGDVIASVVQQDGSARIMLKGAEPAQAGDPAFLESLKAVTKACWEHVEKFEKRELCAVFVKQPALAEQVDVGSEDLKAMGLGRVSVIDADCGIVIRACEDDQPPTPLAYTSLRASPGIPVQPGRVVIPPELPRKTYRDLTASQRQVFEAAAQISRDAIVQLVCLEDEGLRMSVTLRDLPPARGRTVLLPIATLAQELEKGKTIQDLAKGLDVLRA